MCSLLKIAEFKDMVRGEAQLIGYHPYLVSLLFPHFAIPESCFMYLTLNSTIEMCK